MRTCALIIACLVCSASAAQAQWWPFAPRDYEDCAAQVEKSDLTKEARANQLSECDAKFSGRRKPGGGYTYYDFMQNRSFDIAGPNPTPEEQKRIDEQYTVYLENQRRRDIAAAFAKQQQQQAQLQQASLKAETTAKIPVPQERPKPQPAANATGAGEAHPRAHAGDCTKHSFSCEWPRLSEGLNDLKKLFGASPSKGKKS